MMVYLCWRQGYLLSISNDNVWIVNTFVSMMVYLLIPLLSFLSDTFDKKSSHIFWSNVALKKRQMEYQIKSYILKKYKSRWIKQEPNVPMFQIRFNLHALICVQKISLGFWVILSLKRSNLRRFNFATIYISRIDNWDCSTVFFFFNTIEAI